VDGRWNHNIEHYRVICDAIGEPCGQVLDVGCGEGVLVAELASRCRFVTGIDRDRATVEAARAAAAAENVDFIAADFLTHPFAPASFDAVVSVAALHHMDERAALTRMAELVRPGGTVAVVGLGRSRRLPDYAWDAAGAVTTRAVRRRRGGIWESTAPTVWPPPTSYHDVRRLATEVLPGARYRRHVLFRYSVVWRRPSVG